MTKTRGWLRAAVFGTGLLAVPSCGSSDEADTGAATGGGAGTGANAGTGGEGAAPAGGSGATAAAAGAGAAPSGGSAGTGGSAGAVPSGGTAGFPVGGPCTYDEIPGVATIVAIEEAPDDYNCPNDGRRVTFDFVPDDPAAADVQDDGQRLTVFGGQNPPQSCLAAVGIEVDATFAATRLDITSGTCTPTMYRVDGVDLSTCEDECYGP